MNLFRLALLIFLWFSLGCKPSHHLTDVPGQDLPAFLSHPQPKAPPISAHRGGGYPGYPENCLESFGHIVQQAPALIECDVRMSADSVLLLMHDRSLDRTTTGTGLVASQTWAQMRELQLKDVEGQTTAYRIPTLERTLTWARKKQVILTLDVKRGVPFEKVVEAIAATESQAYAAIITYNLADARQVYELDERLLISVGMRNQEELTRALDSGIPPRNMIAFTGTRLSSPDLYRAIHAEGMLTILGTLGNLDEQAQAKGDSLYADWAARGVDIFSSDRPFAVARALGVLNTEDAPAARMRQ